MKPTKRAVALAVSRPEAPSLTLAVKRPESPGEELPGLWGLPAASLRPGEDWAAAALRVGTQKLGAALRLGEELARGTQEREAYNLEMRLHRAWLGSGDPALPEGDANGDVTLYTDWRWASPEALEPAARQGSLCCQLFLKAATA